jgi:signal transduction histidine kinase
MLRKKIISIMALGRWQRSAWLHPPGHSLAVEAAGTQVAASTGEEVFTLAAAAFTAADLAFAKANFADAGSAFSGHPSTLTTPITMVVTTGAAAI